ncbi:hypothetical protein H0E87_001150 [Populus deltoides]|uniref:Uncharacterized protein n=1 Tax=Populus deltoides TaxID=3696 RepID=A0A8T2ZPZ5_POPDE|nr:hypothetical protein H0E87_001150 [Populus deltoides]
MKMMGGIDRDEAGRTVGRCKTIGLLRSANDKIAVLKKKLHRWSTAVDVASAEGGGVVITIQSSPCLWKKKLHR